MIACSLIHGASELYLGFVQRVLASVHSFCKLKLYMSIEHVYKWSLSDLILAGVQTLRAPDQKLRGISICSHALMKEGDSYSARNRRRRRTTRRDVEATSLLSKRKTLTFGGPSAKYMQKKCI